jgi:hypothetical protein
MLGGSLTFLVSLYLSWATTNPVACGNPGSLTCMLTSHGAYFTGWTSGVGDAAALVAVAIAAGAIAAMIRPSLADLLPLGAMAFMLLFLAVGALSLDWHRASVDAHANHVAIVWFFGGYLALGAAVVTTLSAWVFRDLTTPRTALDVSAWMVGLGLLVAFLLPWHRVSFPQPHDGTMTYTVLGVSAATELAAALILLGLSRERMRSPLWAGAGVFALAGLGFGVNAYGVPNHAYGYWVGLCLALALLAYPASSARSIGGSIARPALRDALVAATAILYVVALFLPAQQVCAGLYGCHSASGWTMPASTAALLAGTAAVAVLLRRGGNWLLELAAGVALLVVVAGRNGPFHPAAGVHWRYGAILSFCTAGLFVGACLARSPIRLMRFGARLLPLAAATLLIAAIWVPWWDVLSYESQPKATALTGWLAVASLLLALHILFSWTRPSFEVVLLPLGVLALVVVQAILARSIEPTWGTCIVGVLCLLLAWLGRVELRGGLANFRLPDEIWRVDRISPVED